MFLEAADIKSKFNFSLADVNNDEPIEFASKTAAFKLSKRVSAGNYQLAKGEPPDDESGEEFDRYERLIQAHAYLTVSIVYLNNTQIRAAGNVSQERDENNATTNSYYTPTQLASMRQQYEAEAEELFASFAVVTEVTIVNPLISRSRTVKNRIQL